MTYRISRDIAEILQTVGALPPEDPSTPARVIALDGEENDLRALARDQDLRGVTFTGSLGFPHLEGLDLRGADFSGTTLIGAQFQGARLGGANFTGAVLSSANFTGASLVGAVLTEAHMEYCAVKRAGFEDAVLYRTRLTGTRLSGPQLHAADTLGTQMVLCALLGREPGLGAELRRSLDAGEGCVPGRALDAALGRHPDLDGLALRRWVMGLVAGTPPGHAVVRLTVDWITAWETRRAAGWN